MLKQFYVEYWTKEGRRVGTNISALSSLDAKFYAEKLPDFKSMANYPQLVG